MSTPLIPDVSLGENSVIMFGSAEINVTSGTVRENPAEIPTGCNRTGGYTTTSRGLYNLEVEFDGQFTVDENPMTNAPQLIPGLDADDPCYVYPDYVNLPDSVYEMPVCFVRSMITKIDGIGVISFTGSVKNQGIFGTPASPIS